MDNIPPLEDDGRFDPDISEWGSEAEDDNRFDPDIAEWGSEEEDALIEQVRDYEIIHGVSAMGQACSHFGF